MSSRIGFSRNQIKKLVAKLDRRHVRRRTVEGKAIDYIEGWFVIAQANAIFGFDGWDRQTIHMERIFEQNRFQETHCAYSARVRIQIKAGENLVTREGSGFGEASAGSRAHAHERALKAAETDATKRALVTFGNRFGLSLYDKDQAGAIESLDVAVPTSGVRCFSLHGFSGEVVAETLSAEAFCGGLRQMIAKTQIAQQLDNLAEANRVTLSLLRDVRKDLVSAKGVHYAELLEGLFKRRYQELDETERSKAAIDDPQSYAATAIEQYNSAASSETLDPKTRVASLPISESGMQPRDMGVEHAQPISAIAPSDELPAVGKALTAVAGKGSESRLQFEKSRVDKSQLAIGVQRRVRSKAHLLFVRSAPCIICGELPCHAHHLTFAQPRGLSIKVSDEFTVPLCAMHHNVLHQAHNERLFWKQNGIDALDIAARLWTQTNGASDGRVKAP